LKHDYEPDGRSGDGTKADDIRTQLTFETGFSRNELTKSK
jgi:hypothetical protein